MRSQPAIALLSNGSYSVMITAACAGYSTWRDLDITRWREDATRDCWGQFYYVRDLSDESLWPIGTQPLPKTADKCAFEFHPDRAEFCRRDGEVETRCVICAILGFQLRGSTLRIEPCIPPSWPGFELSYRHRSATYQILVDNSAGTGHGVRSIELDGQPVPNHAVPLSDNRKTHNVRVQLG